MNIRLHFKTIPATEEMVAEVLRCAAGGEQFLEAANLRPQDEVWWQETMQGIVASLRKAISIQQKTDEEILAELPQEAYRGCYYERDKERVRADYLKKIRNGSGWVFILGTLIRDCERLEMEALRMGDEVIKARRMLRAFSLAIAMALGCASIPPDDYEEDS